MGEGGRGGSLGLVLVSVWSAGLGSGGFAASAETGDIPWVAFRYWVQRALRLDVESGSVYPREA